MTKSTFGENLKREREMRGVSLDEISSATRIGTRFLEALENEQWDRLPGGVFNRGFVRAVARFLGLDEESLVAEYALATSDRPEVAVWTRASTSQSTGRGRLLWLLVLLAVVLAAGGWFGWHHYVAARAARGLSLGGPRTSAGQSSPPAAVPQVPQPPMSTGAPVPAPMPATPDQASPRMTPAELAALELTVAAGKTTVVSVVADGKGVFNAKMSAGQNQRFRAQERFEISARDSSALLLELNGQTMAPIGPPGRPGKVTLTRKDLKKPAGGPD